MVETPLKRVRIDNDLWDAATEAAKANGENVSVVIRRALIQYVRDNAEFTVEAVEAGQPLEVIPDGAGGGRIRMPRGDPKGNRP